MSEQAKRCWRDYYDNQYLTGDALPDEGRTFTITDKSRDEVEGKEGREHKLALTFSDGNRFLCNVTNATYIEHLFGSKYPADWVGKRITLCFDPTIKFGKDTVGGIRVIGSPDIDRDVTFQFQENSRKKPRTVTLRKTTTPKHTDSSHSQPVSDDAGLDETMYANAALSFDKGPDE